MQQRMIGIGWLLQEDIQPGSGDRAGFDRLRQSRLVMDPAAAVLTKYAAGFISANCSTPSMPKLSLVRGQCTVT